MLAEAAGKHRQEIEHLTSDPRENFDEENNSNNPVFDNFYSEAGSAAIIGIINFTPDKIEMI